MKKVLIALSVPVILILVGIYLWSLSNDIPSSDEPHIVGEIVSISSDRVLVAEGIKGEEYTGDLEELVGNAIWLSVSNDTELVGIDGEPISFDDLAVGSRVEAWASDEILLSYPSQGGAKKIVLVERREKRSTIACYAGGCSGELCTNNPEAVSTCELLPGMECLREGMSCQSVQGECAWVLSESSARCLANVEAEMGETVRSSRIGHLFEKAEEFLR